MTGPETSHSHNTIYLPASLLPEQTPLAPSNDPQESTTSVSFQTKLVEESGEEMSPIPVADNASPESTVVPGRGKLYAYEVPAMEPGLYDVKVKQTIAAKTNINQSLESVQRVQVTTVSPYRIAPSLVHSFYPPRLRKASANTLPHIVLRGSLPWERSVSNQPERNGHAPVPWLALLVFTSDELLIPDDEVLTVGNIKAKPSATRTVNLPIKALNTYASKFSMSKSFPLEESNDVNTESGVDKDGMSANFIFISWSLFRGYFAAQEESIIKNNSPNLRRYAYLAHITETGELDASGFSTTKVSTVIGHRVRPWSPTTPMQEPVKVHAHLVSLEQVSSVLDDLKGERDPKDMVPLVSLFSWTYTWDIHEPTGGSVELFEELGRHIRPLAVSLSNIVPKHNQSKAEIWMRSRLDLGYTIVRHRDISGESSMALFRGPLVPKHRSSRKASDGNVPIIRPSMHGTDLQIIDVHTKMLDVSYSVAWDLGRSLAGRDTRFSHAVSLLRRELTRHAMSKARVAGQPNAIESGDGLIDSVLQRLDGLFQGSINEKLGGMPEKGPIRWLQSPSENLPATTMGVISVVMTEAKLRRHLRSQTREWVSSMIDVLARSRSTNIGPATEIEIPALDAVIHWVVHKLLSLQLIPALYMFPDPSAVKAETISVFTIDDIWVDALVDGALSVSNTVGGSDDPVRDEIRIAINKYILLAAPERTRIASSGLVVKSALAESFPDLNITAKCTGDNTSSMDPTVIRHASHGDLIVCLFTRTEDQKLRDFDVDIRLPPHQQRFAVEGIKADSMKFNIELESFLTSTLAQPSDSSVGVVWKRGEKGALWNWDTGMLSPHILASLTELHGDKQPNGTFKKMGADSKSIYVAIQLADRDHRLIIPFCVKSNVQRQLFKHLDEYDKEEREDLQEPRNSAKLHNPQQKQSSAGGLPLPSPSAVTSRLIGKSYFTKRVFSLLYPGRSIPARSRTAATQLVFAIKPVITASSLVRVVSLEITIPTGDASGDLLDNQAPIPRIKALNPSWPWIAAIFPRSDAELVVRLEPRVGGAESEATNLVGTGRLKIPNADASFVLMGATINGVVGSNVLIKSREVYVEADAVDAGNHTRESIEEREYVVDDSWVIDKEE